MATATDQCADAAVAASFAHASRRAMPGDVRDGGWSRARLVALACIGLLVGPVVIVTLIVLPGAVICVGVWQDSALIQCIGAAIAVLHGWAIVGLLRAERARMPSMDSVVLTRADAPRLRAFVDTLAARIGAGRIHDIVINTEMNASVTQVPRAFGLAGHRNTVTIGYPLILALDAGELAGVIAHELAHVRRADGATHTLAYRVRCQWQRIERACQHQSFLGRPLVAGFARWFRRVFDAEANSVLRDGEFAADAVAASVVGTATVIAALQRVTLTQHVLASAWDAIWLTSVHDAVPAKGPWSVLGDALIRRWPAATTIVAGAGKVAPAHGTHPGLQDRLARLRLREPETPNEQPRRSHAAVSLLGAACAPLEAEFNAQWWRRNNRRWTSFHASVAGQRRRLAALDAAADDRMLTLETALERAERAEYLIGPAAAIARYKWSIHAFPTAARAYAMLGVALLRSGDRRGADHLTHAISLDARLTSFARDALEAWPVLTGAGVPAPAAHESNPACGPAAGPSAGWPHARAA